jgi:hypothetical protein
MKQKVTTARFCVHQDIIDMVSPFYIACIPMTAKISNFHGKGFTSENVA